jgi:toxin ParE1/3/4
VSVARKPLRIEDHASQELWAAVEDYEARASGLGRRFLAAINVTLNHIAAFPHTGAAVPRVTQQAARRFPVRKFPYHVVFMEAEDVVWVLAFAHDRRRPNYWRRRISANLR